ncbi:MAG TPA: TolC family protein [Lentimicrobium sp.]|nr:TolC family protein [Lentimicrobium sp.]
MKFTFLTTLLTILLLAGSCFEIQAQESTDFSLKQAQDYALLNSAAIKNSDIDLQLAKKKIWETTAIGLPQINAQGNYQHLFVVPEINFPINYINTELEAGTQITAADITEGRVFLDTLAGAPIPLGLKDNTTLDFTVTQLIFSGEYLVGLRASKVFYLMSDQAKLKTESDTRETVASTYALILMLQDNYAVLTRSLENLNKTLNEMKEMNKQGFIEITDVDQIELTTLTLSNGVNSMERQIKAAKDLLKFQIGYPMDKEINLTDNLEAMVTDINMDNLIASGFRVEDNINYQIMDTQVKLNKLNMQREKSTFLPNLAAVYRHQEKFKKIDFDFQPVDIFMLTLNIPLFSSGQRWVKVQQRSLEYQKAMINRDNAANGLKLEYINARNEVINAFDTYTNVKKNLELTQRIYDKTLIKFREGLSTSMDLTQAQNQMLSAQSEYISNLNTLLNAKNKITKLTSNQ